MKKSILVIIDGQNDFMDINGAALPVTGGAADMNRVSAMIDQVGNRFWDIQLTLDSHNRYHIANPTFWVNANGKNPAPFTLITVDDVEKGVWRAKVPSHQQIAVDYVRTLDSKSRYQLCIWPLHCLIGSWGHNLYDPLFQSLSKWEDDNIAIAGKMTKGSNWSTEHYSAVKADVERSDDPSTQLNIDFIGNLQKADRVYLCGQASSHCVANTVMDIVDNFGANPLGNLYLIEDGMSPVPSFESLADDFFRDMKNRGLNICKSTDVISGLA
ncbi:MAG: nicotinamidase/pyrazinamidase [bacterium]|jgi:nicotinamidase/pyrazinamidase